MGSKSINSKAPKLLPFQALRAVALTGHTTNSCPPLRSQNPQASFLPGLTFTGAEGFQLV